MSFIKEKTQKMSEKKAEAKINFKSLLSQSSPFPYREAYKVLRTNLDFISFSGQVKTIAVVSALPNEGKTTVALNLAMTLAETGKRVVIVDADLRNPTIHKYLRLRRSAVKGLTAYLAGMAQVHQIMGTVTGIELDVVLAGKAAPNPSELLSHELFGELLEMLKSKYDYVIIDTPPASIVTDASIVGRQADGAIMVVRQKFTDSDTLKKVKNRLENNGVNLIGTVLNNYNILNNARAVASDYSYYYGDSEE